MPNIYSLKFDTGNWPKTEDSAKQIVWQSSPSDTISMEFLQPTDFQKDLLDPDVRTQFEHYATTSGGVLIDFEVIRIQGFEAAKQVFKFWYPAPRDMRKVYIGSIAFPFADYCYMLRAQSVETGTTGVREAAIYLATSKGNSEQPISEPIKVNSVNELFEHMKRAAPTRAPSDDEQYDVQFPDHPLSKVRNYLRHISDTLVVAPDLTKARPFRITSQQHAETLSDKLRGIFKK